VASQEGLSSMELLLLGTLVMSKEVLGENSIVIPVYKKGEKDNVFNYRRISLLTTPSKIFEKVIYKRLLDHFYTHNILSRSQFGFRKKCFNY
jgi:hypothetical protein